MKNYFKKLLGFNFKRVVALIVMSSIGITSTFSVAALSRKVYINDGENITSVTTMSTEVDKILDQSGIKLMPNDEVVRQDSKEGTVITINRAFVVTVNADGFRKTLIFVRGSAADAISQANVSLSESDAIYCNSNIIVLDEPLQANMEINIERRFNLIITADGRTKEYAVPVGKTVAQALEYAGIPIEESDLINFDLSSEISDNMNIVIDRVGYTNTIHTEIVEYKKIIKQTNDLYVGTSKVQTKGVNGEREVTMQETSTNGVVTEVKEVASKITTAPIDEVVLVGTKARVEHVKNSSISKGFSRVNGDNTLTDHTGKDISYSSVLTGSCTAYTAPEGAKTSTGKQAKVGYVAVNPKIIPYGTKMYICSPDGSLVYGYAIAADTGGALMQGTALVDLYYDSLDECYNFGRRNMCIYILN